MCKLDVTLASVDMFPLNYLELINNNFMLINCENNICFLEASVLLSVLMSPIKPESLQFQIHLFCTKFFAILNSAFILSLIYFPTNLILIRKNSLSCNKNIFYSYCWFLMFHYDFHQTQ